MQKKHKIQIQGEFCSKVFYTYFYQIADIEFIRLDKRFFLSCGEVSLRNEKKKKKKEKDKAKNRIAWALCNHVAPKDWMAAAPWKKLLNSH